MFRFSRCVPLRAKVARSVVLGSPNCSTHSMGSGGKLCRSQEEGRVSIRCLF